MIINVYPSQDNPTNQTLWIFSGSSTANSAGNVQTSSFTSFSGNSTANLNGNLYDANKPSDTLVQLSPLFSSSNTNDIASVRARIPGGGRTNITFAANATNTPTITIASGSRSISHFFMDDDSDYDDIGIRVSASALSYSTGNSSAWVGAGIINKPIGDFFAGTINSGGGGETDSPYFAANSAGAVRVIVNSQVIPEPEEYALIFGLFALGFVFFHRRFQRKRQAQTTTS